MESKKNQLIVYSETKAIKILLSNFSSSKHSTSKPILRLEYLNTNFRTPYNGYLSIIAQHCVIYFDDNSFIPVDKYLKNLYLEKGTVIKIFNKINVESIIYETY